MAYKCNFTVTSYKQYCSRFQSCFNKSNHFWPLRSSVSINRWNKRRKECLQVIDSSLHGVREDIGPRVHLCVCVCVTDSQLTVPVCLCECVCVCECVCGPVNPCCSAVSVPLPLGVNIGLTTCNDILSHACLTPKEPHPPLLLLLVCVCVCVCAPVSLCVSVCVCVSQCVFLFYFVHTIYKYMF